MAYNKKLCIEKKSYNNHLDRYEGGKMFKRIVKRDGKIVKFDP